MLNRLGRPECGITSLRCVSAAALPHQKYAADEEMLR